MQPPDGGNRGKRGYDHMALEEFETRNTTGGAAESAAVSSSGNNRTRSRRKGRSARSKSGEAFPLVRSEEARGVLRMALAAVKEELGFETVSVFAGSPDGWRLLEREGTIQPWHGVLDPSLLEGTSESVEYSDVSTVPGVGPRLASLGCRSVAMMPLPQGTRLLLDSGTRRLSGGWIDRARPYLELAAVMAGPAWMAAGSLRNHEEVAALGRTFTACQEVLTHPEARGEELVEQVREAIRADELFLIADDEAGVRVISSPSGTVRHMPEEIRQWLAVARESGFDDERLRSIAILLGASSRALAGATGRDAPREEFVICGWAEGPALSPVSMEVVARALSTARAAVETRRHAVTSVVDRERNRMAYALHDDLVQTVTGAVLELEALRRRIQRDPKEAMSVLDHSTAEVRRALTDLRGTLFDLSREDEDSEATDAPLARYVEDVVKRWRIPARVAVQGDLNDVPPRVLSVAYSVIREGLTNAAKHTPGSSVTVDLRATDGELTVMVADTGRGFTREQEDAARAGNHFGLNMLRARVHDVGGTMEVESKPARGTRVIARLPIRTESR